MKRTLTALLLALCLLLSMTSAFAEEEVPTLQIRLNEVHWYTLDLTPYLMENNTWVTVPVEMDDLYELGNQIAVSSNCFNNNNRADKSVDLFFTMDADKAGDSFLSTDGMNNWDLFMDRYCNIRLEMFDGEEWVSYLEMKKAGTDEWITLPAGETYRQDENTVVGLFTGGGSNNPYNEQREFFIEDAAAYDAARVVINLHVGTNLELIPAAE